MNNLTQISITLEINNISQVVSLMNTLDAHKIRLLNIKHCLENDTLNIHTQDSFKTFRTTPKGFGRKGEAILKHLADGCTYQEIAEKMEISVDGVRYYVKKIFSRLGVNNGRDAVRIYLTQMKPAI